MTRSRARWEAGPVRSAVIGGVFGVGLFLGGPVVAQEAQDSTLEDIVETGKSRLQESREFQQRINKLDEEIRKKVEAYRSVNKEIDGLEIYLAQLERQVQSQEEEKAELEKSIEDVTQIKRQITPLMLKMVDGLDRFVSLDLPFLEEERTERVATLTETLDRSDVSTPEKFRNVLEAYQTEIEYGRTIEVYRGTLARDGSEREVDFLRIGRIALLYQSLDGTESGVWLEDEGRWKTLPATYNTQVQEGLKIAREQAAPNLIRMPLPAPGEAEE